MAEPAARVGSTTTFREPEGSGSRAKAREKPKPKVASTSEFAGIEAGEPDEQEKHELDAIA